MGEDMSRIGRLENTVVDVSHIQEIESTIRSNNCEDSEIVTKHHEISLFGPMRVFRHYTGTT